VDGNISWVSGNKMDAGGFESSQRRRWKNHEARLVSRVGNDEFSLAQA
jgi:hypothetical protein